MSRAARKARAGVGAHDAPPPSVSSEAAAVSAARLNSLGSKAEIVYTRIGAVRAHLVALPEDGATQVELKGQVFLSFRGRSKNANGQPVFVFVIAIQLHSGSGTQATGGDPPLLIGVERLVVYGGIPEDASDPELTAFLQTYVALNAWPLLRADVSDVSVRLGLNPIILPLYRVASPLPTAGPQSPNTGTKPTRVKARRPARPVAGKTPFKK